MMARITQSFSYSVLDAPQEQFRLLRVTSNPKDSFFEGTEATLQCELEVFDTQNAPEYIAVSYVWGDESPTHLIFVNGQFCAVRHNCWYTLHQLAVHHYRWVFFWIDAICINQDDEHEKSFQVAMMGDIYRGACQVSSCVGRHSEDSEELLRACNQHARYVEELLKDETISADAGPHDRFHTLGRLGSSQWLDDIEPHERARLFRAMSAFTHRSYFSRMWIVQEIILARQCFLHCGSAFVTLQDFEDLAISMDSYRSSKLSGWRHDMLSDGDMPPFSLGFMRITDMLRTYQKSPRVPLNNLLILLGAQECFDVRDKIYALLAFEIDWSGVCVIQPDYTKSVVELSLQMIRNGGLGEDIYPLSKSHGRSFIRDTNPIIRCLRLSSEADVVKELSIRRFQLPDWTSCTTNALPIASRLDTTTYRLWVDLPHVELSADHQNPGGLVCDMKAWVKRGEVAAPSDFIIKVSNRVTKDKRPVRDSSNTVRAVVPEFAKPGDVLVLWPQVIKLDPTPGYIIRKASPRINLYLLLGQALVDGNFGSRSVDGDIPEHFHQSMTVRFGLMDFLLFCCQQTQLEDCLEAMNEDGAIETINKSLETSMTDCDHMFSSFAEAIEEP